MTTLPLAGPLHQDPTVEVYRLGQLAPADRNDVSAPMTAAHGVAEQMLGTALAGVELGDWDRQVIAWLARKDISTLVTVASLLRRATVVGVEAGRREAAEDAAGASSTSAAALEAALAQAQAAVMWQVGVRRQAAEQRLGVEAGDPAAVADPAYDAVLGAWSTWERATQRLHAVVGGGPR